MPSGSPPVMEAWIRLDFELSYRLNSKLEKVFVCIVVDQSVVFTENNEVNISPDSD
jgi:hypothetical protein